MHETRRQKKVSQLIKNSLGLPLAGLVQDTYSCLVTITKVQMTYDLKTANIYLSILGNSDPDEIISLIREKQGLLRKTIASQTKLKYNPVLSFSLDPAVEHEARIDQLLKTLNESHEN